MVLLSSLQPAAAFSKKAKPWVDNGKKNMEVKQYREALYCFHMASFYDDKNKEIKELLEKATNSLRTKGPTTYLVPREPYDFQYILLSDHGENISADDINLEKGSIALADGSKINLESHISRLQKKRTKRSGYWGDKKNILSGGDQNEKIIALTFDDGPSAKYTPKLLDILKKYKVPATFFVLGQNVKSQKILTRRIHQEGHLLANHSWNHPNMARLSSDSIKSQLDKTDKILAELGITDVHYFRPPYGAMSRKLIDKSIELGKFLVLWTVDTRDWQHPSAATILTNILKTVRNGDVILMHDIHPQAVYITESLIKVMTKAGYRFVLLDEIYRMEKKNDKYHTAFHKTQKKKNHEKDPYEFAKDFGSDMLSYAKASEFYNMDDSDLDLSLDGDEIK
jgi:peptidoglycan/xylan/chitin deacetylase (PgdA/CDA1 family)